MAITETETVEVARVEVGDDYRVELWQWRKLSSYTPSQALQLSQELAEAAMEARRALEEREGADRARITATDAGFDHDGVADSLRESITGFFESPAGERIMDRFRYFPGEPEKGATGA